MSAEFIAEVKRLADKLAADLGAKVVARDGDELPCGCEEVPGATFLRCVENDTECYCFYYASGFPPSILVRSC